MYKESFYNIEIEIDEQKNVLLYNSITSALSWFDPETYATFKNRKNILKENVLPDIIRLGYVVEKEKDELSMLKYQNRVSAYNNNPQYLHFVIAPTMLCNYKCIYCFEKQYAKNCNNIMDERTIYATYNFIIKKIKLWKF